jgi:hypothetical protein
MIDFAADQLVEAVNQNHKNGSASCGAAAMSFSGSPVAWNSS